MRSNMKGRPITMEKIYFDGGMGTVLQERGMTGDPVRFNLTHGDTIVDIHRQYINAGADIITANTFGAYRHKHADTAEIIAAAMRHARAAGQKAKLALDMGPLGIMLEPYGDMAFDDAYEIFRETAQTGADNGADLILIETFYCLIELEAAVKAAKTTGLPVFASMTFDKRGRTSMGVPVKKMADLLEELGADALGMNCGFGPDIYKELLPELFAATRLPVLLQPNAGLPEIVNGQTRYNVTPNDFANVMAEMAAMGCTYLGGCCGTAPAHIAAMKEACKGRK
jgi:5-methyltetrahydrofolate--homocysteine methyltransferase